MATKLFVGSLSFNITEEELRELFTPFGNVVSAMLIKDRDTDRSKGFGFVEMESDAEAQAAIKGLNGKEVDNRSIIVNIARPKEDRPARPSYGGGGGGHRRY
ncbi:RNA-binding protein [bacterium]|nr:MAG: RNA-binding protein [bacterium]